jgi:hypothetical protein
MRIVERVVEAPETDRSKDSEPVIQTGVFVVKEARDQVEKTRKIKSAG